MGAIHDALISIHEKCCAAEMAFNDAQADLVGYERNPVLPRKSKLLCIKNWRISERIYSNFIRAVLAQISRRGRSVFPDPLVKSIDAFILGTKPCLPKELLSAIGEDDNEINLSA